MNSRRDFLAGSALAGLGLALGSFTLPRKKKARAPWTGGLVLSTWDHGLAANTGAWNAFLAGGTALDMAEAGVMVTEADLTNLSVGLGGLPDREGHTTLDACIMDHTGRAGSVCFLEKVQHPVHVARLVLEKTPHVMIVGEGARRFAEEQGIALSDYVNPAAQAAWKEWLRTSEYKPIINIENHDTIGLLAMDANANFAGACTTSGLAYKMRGRVGDSPIIGAGLYVDNAVGAATCTGLGETVLRSCTSFLTVELMHRGASPQEACEEAIARLVKVNSFMADEYQVGLLAVNKAGQTGAFGVRKGFNYAVMKDGTNQLVNAGHLLS